jgi:hypothetical protein
MSSHGQHRLHEAGAATRTPVAGGDVLAVARAALRTYANAPADRAADGDDAGPPLLAALVVERDPSAQELAERALARWCERIAVGSAYPSSFGGAGGCYAGARAAAAFYPGIARLAERLRARLTAWAAQAAWRTAGVSWRDYDLVSGPAGIVLSLAGDPACPPGAIAPAAGQLARLCDAASLYRLRVADYADDPDRWWNCGRINCGLAHGVPGVVAALRVACEIAGAERYAAALRNACAWVAAQAYADGRGLLTWPPGGLDGEPPETSRRQAWCYGTPGVAWALWDAGRTLGDPALQALGTEAMASYCARFDAALYVDAAPLNGALGICHGLAGMLAVADAFARHARLAPAAALGARLEALLLERLDEVEQLAETDMKLLTGAAGALATLLSRDGGDRSWLSQLALR